MNSLKKYIYPIIIILLCLLICFLNYTPNTFLTGWDTLHSEFNFSLNFKKLLNIWHSEQGLGAIPAHAQMADLPRVAILYLFHFFLPLNFLRYSYIFLCFILGPLGIYFLIKFLFQKSSHQNILAFIISLLYILNLSTIQQFYVPFEMFPTQWAFLPWIIFFSLKYLQKPTTFNLINFSLFTILATPQAYAPQLWYAFFAIYTLFLIIHSFFNKHDFKKAQKLIIFTLFLNAFWLIPNLFYIFTSSTSPQLNRDNRLYSQEFLLKNRQNGTLTDTPLIKGFYLDWSVFDFNRQTFDNLMPVWKDYFKNPLIPIIGYSIFIISLFGLILSFIKKDKLFISLSPFFIIPFVLLSNRLPLFSNLFDFLIKNSTIRESFRFIFTKLSILLLFGLIIFFSYALNFAFLKIKNSKIIIFSSIFIIITLIIYAFPIFKGQLISSKVRINIPHEYFQMWQFMKTQSDGRVLSLPLNQSSGWQYYNWGYQGSGFLWFGLQQSLIDRDSDRWSNQNEQSYKEFFNYLYSQQPQQFSQTLNKYRVKYIIWDQNIINPSAKNNEQITFKNETQNLLNQLEKQNLVKKINQFDSISLYQTNLNSNNKEIKSIDTFVEPQYQWGYFDATNQNDYVTTNSNNIYFPFRDILNKNQKIDTNKLDINQISSDKWQISLKTDNKFFKIPSLKSTENIIPANVYLLKNDKKITLKFIFPFPEEILKSIKTEFDIPINSTKISINDSVFDTDLITNNSLIGTVNIFINSDNFLNEKIIDFNFNQEKTFYLNEINFNSNSFNFNDQKHFTNTDNSESYNLDLPKISHSFGYIIAIKNQYISGISLRICLKNSYSFLCSIEDELNKNKTSSWNYFLIPSTGNDFGYQLSINNLSFGNEKSESIIDQISIIPIPFNFLSQIKSENQNTPPSDFLILNQSYNQYWTAFYFDNYKPIFLKDHILVNNWANGWTISSTIYDLRPTIYTLFWPQIFEFLGFALLIPTFIWIFKKSKQK